MRLIIFPCRWLNLPGVQSILGDPLVKSLVVVHIVNIVHHGTTPDLGLDGDDLGLGPVLGVLHPHWQSAALSDLGEAVRDEAQRVAVHFTEDLYLIFSN